MTDRLTKRLIFLILITLPLSLLAMETGPITQQVKIASNGGILSLFANGNAYFSADGLNLGGVTPRDPQNPTVSRSNTILVWNTTTPRITTLVPAGRGVVILFDSGVAYFSPDGRNPGGGGNTIQAYQGAQNIVQIVSVSGGVDTIFDGGAVYFSPDGRFLGGDGGSTVRIYDGPDQTQQIIPAGTGVITIFSDGTAYFSPDNLYLGGGGNTVPAYDGPGTIAKIVPVSGGVETEFVGGAVYLSPDGMNLGGGGRTISVPAWTQLPISNPTFGPRDSGKGLIFNGALWISGGFRGGISDVNYCTDNCSYYDLWLSENWGQNWQLASSTNTQINRSPGNVQPHDFYNSYSPLVEFNRQLWAFGKFIWTSLDGYRWIQAKDSATNTPLKGPGPASENVKAFVLNGSIYYVDGGQGIVSISTDGTTWSAPYVIPNFTKRCGPGINIAQGKLWIVGGGACNYSATYNDLWYSSDGMNWTQVQNAGAVKSAEWSPRMWPCMTTDSAGVMWLAGGYGVSNWDQTKQRIVTGYEYNLADVWYSRDGASWKQLKPTVGSGLPDDGGLEPRHSPTCYFRRDTNSLIVAAGKGGVDPFNDNAYVLNSVRRLKLPAANSLP